MSEDLIDEIEDEVMGSLRHANDVEESKWIMEMHDSLEDGDWQNASYRGWVIKDKYGDKHMSLLNAVDEVFGEHLEEDKVWVEEEVELNIDPDVESPIEAAQRVREQFVGDDVPVCEEVDGEHSWYPQGVIQGFGSMHTVAVDRCEHCGGLRLDHGVEVIEEVNRKELGEKRSE